MLTPVIKINEDKCNNCHRCISVCPVKFAIDGSGDKVSLNHSLCIGCAACIDACTQRAREVVDDLEPAWAALKSGTPLIAIAAPAVISSFNTEYRSLIGWLKQNGVSAVFDVSFGAELTVKSYLDHIETNNPRMVIAQPCPAIVSYIEIYKPELIPMLAPADSPMLHTVKMIKEFYPEYRYHKVMVLSPCTAKRREFDDTGLADFNVTIAELMRLLKRSRVNLCSVPPADFDNPPPERAVLFSSPGGLMKTVLREKPEIEDRIRKIEGRTEIYEYLDALPASLKKGTNPLIVDCLNCAKGCNGGPGTLNSDTPVDDLEYIMRQRAEELKKNYKRGLSGKTAVGKLNGLLDKFWKKGLYSRRYKDRSGEFRLNLPNSEELDAIYSRLMKEREEDFLNCASCGYNACETMAVAIHNGLNKIENCHHYKQKLVEIEKKASDSLNLLLSERISHCEELISGISDSLDTVNSDMNEQSSSIKSSATSIESMLASLDKISKSFTEQSSSLGSLIGKARMGGSELKTNADAVNRLSNDIEGIGKLVNMIDDISQRTNLLSMNAAIEAAHAGDSGRGFAVVATEIKRLAENTASKANEVSSSLDRIVSETVSTSRSYDSTSAVILEIISQILELTEVMKRLLVDITDMNEGSTAIMETIHILRSNNRQVVESASSIRIHISELHSNLTEMVSASGNRDTESEDLMLTAD